MRIADFAIIVLVSTLFSSCVSMPKPEQVVSELHTDSTLDRISVVDRAEFANSYVFDRMMKFVKETRSIPVARLTLSDDKLSAFAAVKFFHFTDGGISFVNPSKQTPSNGERILLAQVNCRKGSCSIRTLIEDKVEEKRITGPTDPIAVQLGDKPARIISFVSKMPHYFEARPWQRQIVYLIQSATLPSIDEARHLQSEFSAIHSDMDVGLVIRVDSCFSESDGPLYDLFQLPLPNISRQEFMDNPYLTCAFDGKCHTSSLQEEANSSCLPFSIISCAEQYRQRNAAKAKGASARGERGKTSKPLRMQ